MNKVELCFFDECYQRLDLTLTVNQAGEAEQIDRGVQSSIVSAFERLLNILETVADRSILGGVGLWMTGDGAGSQRVESSIVETL